MEKKIPGPPGWPFIGNLLDLRDGDYPLQALERLSHQYGPIFKITNGGNDRVVVSSVELLDQICDDSVFVKKPAVRIPRRPGAHVGLFSSENDSEDWSVAHRVLMPAFGPLSIEALFDGMYDIAKQMALKWARQPNEALLVSNDFTSLTLDTIALCAMGYRFNSFYRQEPHPFVKAMVNTLTESQNRGVRPAFATKLMEWTGQAAAIQADADLQRAVGMEIVEKRKTEGGQHKDLLDMMINGKDPKTGKPMPDGLIAANMQTFLVAGHETTSSLLSFSIYNLLKNPAAYLAAQAEVDSVLGDGPIKLEQLKQLKYITAVLRESLRLYPTAPAFNRIISPEKHKGSYNLGGYELEQGVPVLALLGEIHRDTKVYGDDADQFKPERMMDGNFEKLPKNAWKPFGTGVRACIGRPFAWQEAMLVVALLLQRFDLRLDNPAYDLKLQVNLTTKPRDLYIRASLRDGVDATELETLMTSGYKAKPKAKQADQAATADPNAKPMKIFFGSNTGTCEALAQRLSSEAIRSGFNPTVEPVDLAARNLPKGQPIVIITASYEGQPPDNARRFVEWLSTLEKSDLDGVDFAVFGCGHRDWTSTFQRIPTLVDDTLASTSASRMVARGLSDVAEGRVFDDFDAWKDGQLWPHLKPESAGISVSHNLDMEISGTQRSSSLRQDVVDAEVIKVATLTQPGQPAKLHCEFQLPERLSYQCGDYLAILPFNQPALVERVMKRFDLSLDSSIRLKPGAPTTLPTDRWISVRDILSGYVELSQPVTMKELQSFRELATSPGEQAELDDQIASRGDPLKPRKYLTAFDLLEHFPSVKMAFSEFVALLPPLRVRLYSISSSPAENPSVCSVTYSMHSDSLPEPMRKTYDVGVTSTYLSTLLPGAHASVSIVPGKPDFHLPSVADAGTTPMIMICAGTGLAPFRGFVQDRAERLKEQPSLKLAPALLYAGCRSSTADRLYAAEMDKWATQGAVELRYAFSREPEASAGAKYVQDRLRADATRFIELWKAGAKIYICGSNGLVAEVRNALKDVVREAYREHEGKDLDDATLEARLDKIKSDRFVADVFG